MPANYQKKIKSQLDWTIFSSYVALVLIGILCIYSVQSGSIHGFGSDILGREFAKQAIWFIFSLTIGVGILYTDSKLFSNIAFISYALGIMLMLLVLVIGSSKKGSSSWLDLGFFAFQPGELAKLLTSLALARLISSKDFNMKRFRDKIIAAVVALLPAVILLFQNETGLSLVYFSFFLLLYREGYPLSILILGFGAILLMVLSLIFSPQVLLVGFTAVSIIALLLTRKQWQKDRTILYVIIGAWILSLGFSQIIVPYTFKNVMKDYQIERVYSMLGRDVPEAYRKGKIKADVNTSDYNSRQSKIAISSGGFFGKGFLNGTQTKGSYVPEQSTDFIFCTVGEEFGTIGSLVVIGLFVLLLVYVIRLAERQRSVFSRVYAYGFACVVFFHAVINIGMTVGLAPVIGITLPYMSYGGTSLLTFSTMLFILLRLDLDRSAIIR